MPIAVTKELSSVSASAGAWSVCPLLSAVLNLSPSVLSSRSFHDWWLNGCLTKVNLGQDLLTQIDLLLAVVVMVMMVMMMPVPLHAVGVMPFMSITMMFLMVMLFSLCCCILFCGFLTLFKLQ